ncbi:MAG: DUF4268 domain-containing protein [Armatimonadetes bacterium]|nr:DUF4268 domain-containing protein [Armatimonadota bacterium]
MSDMLGNLKLADIRTLWPDEAADFTPWLARDENMAQLGEALGLELEVEHTEVAVGPYSADILARDSGSGDPVVIENQLGKTNHDHLGKAITYAAALGAGTVVWIASDFSEEHRRAVDWLNENGSGDVLFFGVRVELWRIDDSRPAVRFNVVAKPAEVSVKVVGPRTEELSEVRKLQLEWWNAFRQALMESKAVPSARAPRPQYWYNVPLGRTGISLSNIADTQNRRIGVRVYLRQRYGGEKALVQLQGWKQEIEAEIGQPLLWNPNPDNRDKTIALYREAELTRRDKWPEYLKWMVDVTRRFRQAFAPRLRILDLSSEDIEEAEGAGA